MFIIVLLCVFALAINVIGMFACNDKYDSFILFNFFANALVISAIILLAGSTMDDEVKCVCGAVVKPEWSYCAECGAKLEADW